MELHELRKTTSIAIGVVGVVIVGAVGYGVWNFFTDSNSTQSDLPGIDGRENAVPIPDPKPEDKDRDGLSDAQEVELGTNPREMDSDADFIPDGEEVHRWKTDPLKKDTDGDGYSDFIEIGTKNNPNGAGPLPTST